MKILSYILISLFLILVIGYCTITNSLKKTTWGGWTPPPDTELIEGENERDFQSEDKKLSPKDAVERLKSTKSFADDVRFNPITFSVKIDQLTPDTSGFYYVSTICLDTKKKEQLISNYRISSRSGSVAKQLLKTNKWIEVN
jgi:hypothetical protein